MASINKKREEIFPVLTHGGAKTTEANAEEKLYRSVMTCLLWEDAHYEDGQTIAQRISSLVPQIDPSRVAQIAIDARNLMNLRHVPLLVAREMARHDSHKFLVSKILFEIIQRPDELTEFLSIYWKDKKDQPISSQVRKGLANAFCKFNEYQLSKYNQMDKEIRLKDVLFLVRPKHDTLVQKKLWKKLADDKLATPDTWEVEISAEGNNKQSWERLINEKKLGAFALIRNLRNMIKVNVDSTLIKSALNNINDNKILPFRYLFAALHAPQYENELEQALFRSIVDKQKLKGKTILVVDVSGSMYGTAISKHSDADRAKVSCSLAVIVRELCEEVSIYATGGCDSTRIHKTQIVPSRRGFALSDAIYKLKGPLGGGGIFLTQCMNYIFEKENVADRIIVITDEQDCATGNDVPSKAKAFGKHNYIINVNTNEHGIGYKKWTHINGWSEAVLDFIRINEKGYNSSKISECLQNQKQIIVPKKVVSKVSVSKNNVIKKTVPKKSVKHYSVDYRAKIEEEQHKKETSNIIKKKTAKK